MAVSKEQGEGVSGEAGACPDPMWLTTRGGSGEGCGAGRWGWGREGQGVSQQR